MSDRLTNEDVANILRLVDTLDFAEVTLRTGDVTLTVRTEAAAGLPPLAAPAPAPAAPAPAAPAPVPAPVPAPAPGPAPVAANGSAQRVPILSPMLGTFYARPEPGAEPFVTVGSLVEETTVVCIVEVMKMMNSVQAGVRGRVVEVRGVEGQLVEAGGEVFVVEPDAGTMV
jgi:acetyl-CoA carboxylase biotin carboxyl carrier protein